MKTYCSQHFIMYKTKRGYFGHTATIENVELDHVRITYKRGDETVSKFYRIVAQIGEVTEICEAK